MKNLTETIVPLLPLPEEAVFLGEASDGFPVLWDTSTYNVKNIMIWDKTPRQGLQILRVIADYLLRFQKGKRIEFLVLTRFPEDWGKLNENGLGVNANTPCIGVLPFHSTWAGKYLQALCSWESSARYPIILLIDGLENINRTSKEFQDNLACLLYQGRARNICVIGTSKTKYRHEISHWTNGFQHEIHGSDVENVFTMLEGMDEHVLHFFVPATEIE